jgi:hypothetical protein
MSTPVLPGRSERALRTAAVPANVSQRSNCEPGIGFERRVRHQARDVAALMAFSALVSVSFAVALLLITTLGS